MTRVRPRTYQRHGLNLVEKAAPYLVKHRITDPTVEDGALSPFEAALRGLRRELTADIGPNPPTAKIILLDAILGSTLILWSVDSYILTLAEKQGLVSGRTRRALRIAEQRARLADSLVKQLTAFGLKRHVPEPKDALAEYFRAQQDGDAGEPSAGNAVSEPEPEPKRPNRTPVR